MSVEMLSSAPDLGGCKGPESRDPTKEGLNFEIMSVEMLSSAPDLGGCKGPESRDPTKEGPYHVHLFSHICDMCVPLSHF